MCPSTNGGSGVYARSWAGPAQVGGTRVDLTIDVWFKEHDYTTGFGPGGKAIVRVRYRYSFYRSSVKAWIGVTTYADTITGIGAPFVKEPKLTALSRGGGYKRISVLGGLDGTGFLLGMMAGEPEGTGVLSTSHSDHDTRKRVRWDFATSTGGGAQTGCSTTSPCLNAVMRAVPMVDGNIFRSATAADWEGSGFGLDQWSVLSDGRAKAYPRDTYGDALVTSCGVPLIASDDTNGDGSYSDAERSRASERATPAQSSRRRWEVGGWKSGAVRDPYQSAFAFFAGWEDDRGPEDCEPHQRRFGAAGESFGTFASYSLNDGWTLQ
jgi:hypothetical protein